MRGTAVERSQDRQRKLDGIVAWYFDHVMQSLPLMLQIGLLLLGCALSRYLWEIDTTVTSVVLGVTSFGIIFYLFIIIAGAASESCPYQTPGSHALRYLVHSTPSIIASAFRNASRESKAIRTINSNVRCYRPWWSRSNIMPFLMDMVREFPVRLSLTSIISGQRQSVHWSPLFVKLQSWGRTTKQLCWACDAFRGCSRHPWTKPSAFQH